MTLGRQWFCEREIEKERFVDNVCVLFVDFVDFFFCFSVFVVCVCVCICIYVFF